MLGDRAHNLHQLHEGLVLHTTQQDVDVVAGLGVLCGSCSTALHETIGMVYRGKHGWKHWSMDGGWDGRDISSEDIGSMKWSRDLTNPPYCKWSRPSIHPFTPSIYPFIHPSIYLGYSIHIDYIASHHLASSTTHSPCVMFICAQKSSNCLSNISWNCW